MEKEIALFEEGLNEYTWTTVISENLALAIWILLGSILISQISLITGLAYMLFALVMILVVMRKLICTRCFYYGKRCHVGWGKISSALFKKEEIEKFSTCAGQKIAPVLFGLLAIIPVIFGIISMVSAFSVLKCVLFILMAGAILYSSIFARKKSCEKCKMKLVCPGSAAK